jgi:hypothetical protein
LTDTTRIAESRARLTRYIAAETAVLQGQAYSMGQRSLTRADLSEIRKAIVDLYAEINSLEGGSIRLQRVVPIE